MPPITLQAGALRATIDPDLGCALTEFTIDAPFGDRAPILRTPPIGVAEPAALASFLMAPWVNRIADARFAFEGTTHRLHANNPDHTAIHGEARDHPWSITDRSPVSIRCSLDRPPTNSSGTFPFAYACTFRAELSAEALDLDLDITNTGETNMPAACGHHPYFSRRLLDDNDDVHLRLPVAARYPTQSAIPTGPPRDDDLCERLRRGTPLGSLPLDDLFQKAPGPIEITWPASGVRVTLDAPEPLTHLMLFAPRAAVGPHTRPTAGPTPWFCLEPQTAAADAFNALARGDKAAGARTLAPGESLRTRLRMTAERLEPSPQPGPPPSRSPDHADRSS